MLNTDSFLRIHLPKITLLKRVTLAKYLNQRLSHSYLQTFYNHDKTSGRKKEIKQNWTGTEIFGNCFCVILQKFYF